MLSADELNRKGIELHQTGDTEAARLHYLAALTVDPNYAPALANLAHIASELNQLPVAVSLLKRVVQLTPHDGNQWNNFGNVLQRLNRRDEARAALAKAAEICPDNWATWHNLALLEYRAGNQDEAIVHLERVEALGNNSPRVAEDKAHMLLAKGNDLPAALEVYESRWSLLMHQEPWDFHIPEWQGESLNGQTLLLHAEQGFGDTIMTSRFAKALTKRGAKVTIGVPPPLASLFEHQEWPDVDVLNIVGMTVDDAKRFDYHSPMYSAMRHLGVRREDINPEPYLVPPNITTAEKVAPNAFNIGICWASGRRGNEYDWRRRVTSLDLWLPLAESPGVHLHSLCVDQEAVDELTALGAEPLVHHHRFADFAETAAFIDKLDLVITVDTAIVHLAGALGKQTWMLSQFNPCWRWWNLKDGLGAPWYGTVDIIPQLTPEKWGLQLHQAKMRLDAELKS